MPDERDLLAEGLRLLQVVGREEDRRALVVEAADVAPEFLAQLANLAPTEGARTRRERLRPFSPRLPLRLMQAPRRGLLLAVFWLSPLEPPKTVAQIILVLLTAAALGVRSGSKPALEPAASIAAAQPGTT